MLWYADPFVSLHLGSALDCLRELPDESIHCVVTSPPYWTLRQYEGQQEQVWDDPPAAGCEHQWGAELLRNGQGHLNVGFNERWGNSPGNRTQEKATSGLTSNGKFCQLCPAWRGALGQEPTPQLYIQHLMQIMAELKRVLRKDGICWVNLDCKRTTRNEPTTKMRLKKGLSAEQEQYVLQELAKARISSTQQLVAETMRSRNHGHS